jgi:branched-chain amino acid aminotransferase
MAGTSPDTTVWIDGRVLPAEQAWIAATDHGVIVGDGVFETCKIVDNAAFALNRHLLRLQRSASVLELSYPEPSDVRAAVDDLLAACGPIPLGRLRITLTSGPGPLGSDRGPSSPTLVLAASGADPWPGRIAVVTVPWTRNEHSAVAGAKTTSYAENVVALRVAHDRGAHEALLTNTRGLLCEGTGSNVVVERDGVLVTPPLSSGCLAGITRALFLEWSRAEGLPVIEDDVTLEDLSQAPEVLLTSSTRDVQRVNVVDGRELPGTPAGKAAEDLFVRRAAGQIDP